MKYEVTVDGGRNYHAEDSLPIACAKLIVNICQISADEDFRRINRIRQKLLKEAIVEGSLDEEIVNGKTTEDLIGKDILSLENCWVVRKKGFKKEIFKLEDLLSPAVIEELSEMIDKFNE